MKKKRFTRRLKALKRLFNWCVKIKANLRVKEVERIFRAQENKLKETHTKTIKTLSEDNESSINSIRNLLTRNLDDNTSYYNNEIEIIKHNNRKTISELDEKSHRFAESAEILKEMDRLNQALIDALRRGMEERRECSKNLIQQILITFEDFDTEVNEYDREMKARRKKLEKILSHNLDGRRKNKETAKKDIDNN